MIDKTRSIGVNEFGRIKVFVEELVEFYKVGRQDAHISIMTYAGKGNVLNHLKEDLSQNKADLKTLIRNIDNELSDPTCALCALRAVRDEVFTPDNGDRPNVANRLIFLADGQFRNRALTDAKNIIHDLDVSIVYYCLCMPQ